MTPTINETAEMLESDFAMFETWEEKYEYLMDLGRNLHWPANRQQSDSMLIRGCQSQVWIGHELNQGKIEFLPLLKLLLLKAW